MGMEPTMSSAVRQSRYSQSALRFVRSWPVTCTAISAGTLIASRSAAPGRTPAAVGAGGSDSTETWLYLSAAPARPFGCNALIHDEILLLPPDEPTLGRRKHFSSVEKCVLPRSCTRWSPKSSSRSACRLLPA